MASNANKNVYIRNLISVPRHSQLGLHTTQLTLRQWAFLPHPPSQLLHNVYIHNVRNMSPKLCDLYVKSWDGRLSTRVAMTTYSNVTTHSTDLT